MGRDTRIEWVDHTFNPWIGCTRIASGHQPSACDNCYAAAMSHRRGWARFEHAAPRRRTTASNWRQPLAWNRRAAAAGVRARVFGPSLADPFDAEVADDWRRDYLALIEATPWLDWILLTKRPQVARKFFAGRAVPDNLWPGITAETQKMLDLRAPALCAIPARVHVLSAEPMLGPIDATHWLGSGRHALGWVIAGGESGPRARPSHPAWLRDLRDQCVGAGVPFFFKQWGEWRPADAAVATAAATQRRHVFDDPVEAVEKVGRRSAGAALDGRPWRQAPLQDNRP